MKSIQILKNLQKLQYNKNDGIASPCFADAQEFSFSQDKITENDNALENLITILQKTERKPTKSPVCQGKRAKTPVQETFKPTLNKNSIKISKNSEKSGKSFSSTKRDISPQPLPEEKAKNKKISLKEFIDRHYTRPVSKKDKEKRSTPTPPLDKVDSQCTFKPSIDQKSKEIVLNHKVNLYEQGVKKTEEKNKERLRELKKKELEELKLCTFSPKISKRTPFYPRKDIQLTPVNSYSKKNRDCLLEF